MKGVHIQPKVGSSAGQKVQSRFSLMKTMQVEMCADNPFTFSIGGTILTFVFIFFDLSPFVLKKKKRKLETRIHF